MSTPIAPWASRAGALDVTGPAPRGLAGEVRLDTQQLVVPASHRRQIQILGPEVHGTESTRHGDFLPSPAIGFVEGTSHLLAPRLDTSHPQAARPRQLTAPRPCGLCEQRR
jgi:hypothetical protein